MINENIEQKECILNWISKIHLKSKSFLAKKIKKFELTVEQRMILLLLYENKAMTQSEICKEIISESSNLSVTLKRMEQNGYIIKSNHLKDKRATLITPTKKAYEIEKELKQIGIENLNYLLKDIDNKEHDIALKVVKDIYKKILQDEFEKLL